MVTIYENKDIKEEIKKKHDSDEDIKPPEEISSDKRVYMLNQRDDGNNDIQQGAENNDESKKSPEQIFSDEEVDIKANRVENEEILSDFILKFISKIPESEKETVKIEEKTVQVNNTLGKLATVYEKIRNAVEYKGEHVLRRNAIERILKRLAWEQESIKSNVNTEQMAEDLIKELIWARYLGNKSVPLSKINEVSKVLDKYFYIIQNINNTSEWDSIAHMRSWLFGIASSEVENTLDKEEREIYIKLMQDWFTYFFKWEVEDLNEKEKSIQIYLAIHRALMKSDEPIMRYYLLLKEFPRWEESRKEEINNFIQMFPSVYKSIEEKVNYSGRIGLYRRIQRHTAAFEIMREVVNKNPEKFTNAINDEVEFEKKIRVICREKYSEIKEKVNRGIIRSILYIFITKVIFVLFLEVPYEIYHLGDVRYLPLTMNIMFPPLLMFVIGLSIKAPDDKNTGMIIDRLKTVVYKQNTVEKNSFNLHEGKGKSTLVRIFGVLYTLFFLGVFWGVGYVLIRLGFTLFGLLLFFVFLSLVLLFAFRIKYHANQMKVETEDSGLISHLFDYFTLPFLNLGFFLSKGLSKLNFFTIILDFLIEAPLKSIIDISEEWISFIKDKKDKVVEVPE